MTKYNFIEETDKLVTKTLDHELVRSKIDETLMNLKAEKGGLEEMALEEIATRAAAVGRALTLDREPHLIRAGYVHPDPQPWHEWDPVMVHFQKPDRTIQLLAHAQQALEENRLANGSEEYHKQIDWEVKALQKLIESIEEQI